MRLHDSFSVEKAFLAEDAEKQKLKKMFRRAVKLSWILFFLTFILFIFWIIGHNKEHYLVSNSNLFSRVFFFLNPNIFKKVFLQGAGLTLLQNAVSWSSFMALLSYIVTFVSFVLIVAFALWLFVISFYISVKPFHFISCLSVFPVIGWLLINWFILKLVVYQIQQKRKRTSKFDNDFLPEKFESNDLLDDLNPSKLASRTVTSSFGKSHYDAYFKKSSKDYLQEFYEKLISYTS